MVVHRGVAIRQERLCGLRRAIGWQLLLLRELLLVLHWRLERRGLSEWLLVLQLEMGLRSQLRLGLLICGGCLITAQILLLLLRLL